MMEKQQPAAKGLGTAILLVLLILLPIIYALSFGPAWWLAYHGYIATDSLRVVYYPIDALCESFARFEAFFVWYQSCFVPANQGVSG